MARLTASTILFLVGLSLCAAFSPIYKNRVSTASSVFVKSKTAPRMSEDESSVEASVDATPVEESPPPKPAVKCPNCDLCDGSGRILGGIGVVLPWWPIKAYRPCPNFIESGGRYVRSGQGLDEIAFGRDSTFKPDDI